MTPIEFVQGLKEPKIENPFENVDNSKFKDITPKIRRKKGGRSNSRE